VVGTVDENYRPPDNSENSGHGRRKMYIEPNGQYFYPYKSGYGSTTMEPTPQPYIDPTTPNNVTVIKGKSTMLACVVRNVGNAAVRLIIFIGSSSPYKLYINMALIYRKDHKVVRLFANKKKTFFIIAEI
jgi:hypothetical protein